MSWLFFLDESGHDGKNTPHVVVGGFGIEEQNYENFILEVKTLYKNCFGVSIDNISELKGSELLKKNIFKWAKSRDKMDDETRHNHIARFFSQKSGNIVLDGSDFAAYGQACILFVEELLELIFKYKCNFIASMAIKKHNKMPTVDLISKLELGCFNYISEFKKNVVGLKVLADKTDDSLDQKREIEFYVKFPKKPNWKISFHKSEEVIGIQIADLLSYLYNWGSYLSHNRELHNLISEDISKLIPINHYFNGLRTRVYWYENNYYIENAPLIKSSDVAARA